MCSFPFSTLSSDFISLSRRQESYLPNCQQWDSLRGKHYCWYVAYCLLLGRVSKTHHLDALKAEENVQVDFQDPASATTSLAQRLPFGALWQGSRLRASKCRLMHVEVACPLQYQTLLSPFAYTTVERNQIYSSQERGFAWPFIRQCWLPR